MSDTDWQRLLAEQKRTAEEANGTISDLTEMLNKNTEKLQRATFECLEQTNRRVEAEAELSSRRFAHWAVHFVSAVMIARLLVCLVGGK